MSEHTPGPWKVDDDSDFNPSFGGIVAEVKVPDGRSFGRKVTGYRRVSIKAWDVHPRDKDPAFLDGDANARLIAAAPELLKALKDVVASFWDHPDRNESSLEIAREVIAKVGS